MKPGSLSNFFHPPQTGPKRRSERCSVWWLWEKCHEGPQDEPRCFRTNGSPAGLLQVSCWREMTVFCILNQRAFTDYTVRQQQTCWIHISKAFTLNSKSGHEWSGTTGITEAGVMDNHQLNQGIVVQTLSPLCLQSYSFYSPFTIFVLEQSVKIFLPFFRQDVPAVLSSIGTCLPANVQTRPSSYDEFNLRSFSFLRQGLRWPQKTGLTVRVGRFGSYCRCCTALINTDKHKHHVFFLSAELREGRFIGERFKSTQTEH